MGGILGKMSRLSISECSSSNEAQEKKDKILHNEQLITPQRNFIADRLMDPRSATLGIKRTPLILTKIEKTENETPVKPKPYLETDLDEIANEAEESEPSSILNEEDLESEPNTSLATECNSSISFINDKIEIPEPEPELNEVNNDIHAEVVLDNEIINTEGKIINSPAVNKIKKTVIYEDETPVLESTPVKKKNGRTPLGFVSTNSSPLPSPLGGKQWRGIREERVRLGLENTPPGAEPFLDSVQSAPGKVGARRAGRKSWARSAWAHDESLVI